MQIPTRWVLPLQCVRSLRMWPRLVSLIVVGLSNTPALAQEAITNLYRLEYVQPGLSETRFRQSPFELMPDLRLLSGTSVASRRRPTPPPPCSGCRPGPIPGSLIMDDRRSGQPLLIRPGQTLAIVSRDGREVDRFVFDLFDESLEERLRNAPR